MPVLTPAELWEATGRIGIPEIFHVQDRNGRHFVLPLTHEETVTFHAREIQSYKQLPQLWYHFQTKDRDEPRPRGGLLRVREFIMKDSYSFDRDEDGLDRSFETNRGAYETIFERCGIEAVGRPGRERDDGRQVSVDFLAPSGSGENTLVTCENGDYAADLEIAHAVPRPAVLPAPLARPRRSRRRASRRSRRSPSSSRSTRARPRRRCRSSATTARSCSALVRGDDRLSESKLFDALAGGVAARDRGGDPEGVRRRRRLARACRLRGRDRRRRDAARGAVRRRREPRRLAPARRRGRARLRAALRRPRASRARATPARSAAAGSASRRRSRSATSSTSGASTRCRSARRSSTRTGPRSRCSAAATGSAPAA